MQDVHIERRKLYIPNHNKYCMDSHIKELSKINLKNNLADVHIKLHSIPESAEA